MHRSGLFTFILLVVALISFGATADEWVVAKLRGGVFVYVEGGWEQLRRGDTVPDDRVIRTQPSGRATFVRGGESVEVGPSTQIQIIDRRGRAFTTIRQFYGQVEVDAEVQNVEHFGVRTPYLAAVVKGTRFIVTSDKERSLVEVVRGRVAVEDFATRRSVLLLAGQQIDSVDFVARSADGLPVDPAAGAPAEGTFAGLGGGVPSVLLDLFGAGQGLQLGLGAGNGLGLGIGLEAGSGVALGVDAIGGVAVGIGAGAGGLVVGLDASGAGAGVSLGSGAASVNTPVGGLGLLPGSLF